MIQLKIYIVIFFVLMSVIQTSWAATASINRTIISENETVVLTVETQDMSAQQIDFSPLETDFEIISTSQSSRIQLFNGAGSSSKQWQITLAPLHSGTLTIPALTVGKETTTKLELSVEDFDPADLDKKAQEVFLETSLSKDQVYVQEQIIFTIKLFHSAAIRSGSLTSPEVKNAVIERLGEDISYQAEKNGTRYSVLERRFVIFPQKSGTLTIDPIRFSGQIQDKRTPPRSRFDDFLGQSLFNDPFSPSLKNFRTKSTPQSFKIQARPDAAQGKDWLPAQNLEITENITEQTDQLEIGQPLTRTITITAKGLNSSQLPELLLPELNNAKSYRDQKSQKNQVGKIGITGISQQKFALVPTAEGTLQLPEIKIPWWDVIENKQRFAILAARTMTVAPGGNNSNLAVTPSAIENTRPSFSTPETGKTLSSIWIIVASLFFILWCVTLYLLWREKHKQTQAISSKADISEHLSLRKKQGAIETACNENKIEVAYTSLMVWAKARWPEHPPHNLVALASLCKQDDAVSALQNMDRTLYSTEQKSWNGKQFLTEINSLLHQKPHRNNKKTSPELPPLYARNP